jgi:hypothetical protein
MGAAMTLKKRIERLEAQQRSRDVVEHHIPILFYPWELCGDPEAREAWLDDQLVCQCKACEGVKTVGLLVPGKAPSAEAWAAMVRAAEQQRQRLDAHREALEAQGLDVEDLQERLGL